jgi:hypothetical protein
MYIELLKNCLLDNIYGSVVNDVWNTNRGEVATDEQLGNGSFWPLRAHTMIGLKRIDNIQYCIENVRTNNIPGDFIETGVWRGGASIFMAGLNKYYGMKRKVFVADSFEGLPPPDVRYPADRYDVHHTYKDLIVPLEQVKNNFEKYNLLDENVIFVKGFFEDSLQTAPIQKLSVLRLDGDMYSSTIHVLDYCYDKLTEGGFVIIDDYGGENCKQAVLDFRAKHNILSPIIQIDHTGVFWKK